MSSTILMNHFDLSNWSLDFGRPRPLRSLRPFFRSPSRFSNPQSPSHSLRLCPSRLACSAKASHQSSGCIMFFRWLVILKTAFLETKDWDCSVALLVKSPYRVPINAVTSVFFNPVNVVWRPSFPAVVDQDRIRI